MPPAPLTIDEALKSAARLARRGDGDGARRLYHEILQRNPGHKKARKALKALQGADSGRRPALSQEDFKHLETLRRRDPRAARSEAARLCRSYPEQPALHNLHGVILAGLGEHQAAAGAFEKALRLEPGFTEALNNLASTLDHLGRNDEALAVFEALLARIDNDPELHFNHGNALQRAGRTKEAADAFGQALRLRPLYPEAHNNLGNALQTRGETTAALTSYENAVEIDPEFIEARRNLASLCYRRERYGAAEQHYREVLRRQPGDGAAQLGVALALVNRGDTPAARAALEAVAPDNPGYATASHLLAALRGERPAAAPAAYTRAVFDSYAEHFEQHLTADLGYDGPRQLRELLQESDIETTGFRRLLDIGCGTGLGGVAFAELASERIGLDLSADMLRKAADKKVYAALHQAEATDFLAGGDKAFDLVLAADMLPYVGDLAPLFRAVAGALEPGGVFLCTTELTPEGAFLLQPTGRFAHDETYLAETAAAAGLALQARDTIQLRRERGAWLPGGAYCLQKR